MVGVASVSCPVCERKDVEADVSPVDGLNLS
jgi:hypothetical protein